MNNDVVNKQILCIYLGNRNLQNVTRKRTTGRECVTMFFKQFYFLRDYESGDWRIKAWRSSINFSPNR